MSDNNLTEPSQARDESHSEEIPAALYIVATPIGNLGDITQRALDVLRRVAVIAAEDTRHSKKLLDAYGIQTPLLALHEHNEAARSDALLARVSQGEAVALVSDAGTPLISDPGFVLVRNARAAGLNVIPIPGACAVVAALCAAGLPTDRFHFVGFLPSKGAARRQQLSSALELQVGTLVLYESPRRILDMLVLLAELDDEREVVLAKELTKTYERFLRGTPNELQETLQGSPDLQKGEWVVMIAPALSKVEQIPIAVLDALAVAAAELPLKKACELLATLTPHKKNALYKAFLARDDE